jgi:predicted amidophosphoribosyltransferase
MVDQLNSHGLQLIAAINENKYAAMKKLDGTPLNQKFDHVITRSDTKSAKGSPTWIGCFRQATGVDPHEMVYLGDSRHDMITATRGPMLYFRAEWANSDSTDYGIPAKSPLWFSAVVRNILTKEHPWSWDASIRSEGRNPYEFRALLPAGRGLAEPLQGQLIKLLKNGEDSELAEHLSIHQFVNLHLLASLFHDDLFSMDYWTSIPGHKGATDQILAPALDLAAKLSRHKYMPNLLIRHREAKRSNAAYKEGGLNGALKNLLDTLLVNTSTPLKGKRVLVLDNYLTYGSTAEAARLLLYGAGACEVVCVSVGKYPSWPNTTGLNNFAQINYGDLQFQSVPGRRNDSAENDLLQSYQSF